MKSIKHTVIGIVLIALLAVGCSANVPGILGGLQNTKAACPKGGTIAVFIADDLNSTDRSSEIASSRASVINSLVRRAVVCEGALRVVAFSASTSASQQVYDNVFKLAGATEIAKLRKAPAIIASTVTAIDTTLTAVTKTLPRDGADPVGVTDLAGQYIAQLNQGSASGTFKLDATVLTDGLQNSSVVALPHYALTSDGASDIAEGLREQLLPPNSSLTFAGIGKVAGTPLSTTYVRGLITFFSTYCARTHATCSVVTDYAAEGE